MAFRLPVVSPPEFPEDAPVSASGRLPKWLRRPIPKSNAN
ncbi:MAG: lipoyl synthase, partial [Planctomycetota bacterium]|nr:lipoyl synthase [Planctomycetota bacterium]